MNNFPKDIRINNYDCEKQKLRYIITCEIRKNKFPIYFRTKKINDEEDMDTKARCLCWYRIFHSIKDELEDIGYLCKIYENNNVSELENDNDDDFEYYTLSIERPKSFEIEVLY